MSPYNKKPWSPEDDLIIERMYSTSKLNFLEELLNRRGSTIRARASFLKVPKDKDFRSKQQSENGIGKHGISKEDAKSKDPIIIARYATENTEALAKELGISVSYLQKRAAVLDVKKCRKFLSKQQSEIVKNSTAFGFKENNKLGGRKSKKASKSNKAIASSISALANSGHTRLANITAEILRQIKRAPKKEKVTFDFLTIHDGWGL